MFRMGKSFWIWYR